MLEYVMDMSPQSWSDTFTPDIVSRSFPFCVTDIGWFDCGKKYYTKRDEFDSMLAIITEHGCGSMLWKGQKCDLEPGTAVLIDCNIYHEYRTISYDNWRFYFIHFNTQHPYGYRHVLFNRLTPVTLRCPESVFYQIARMHQEDEVGISAYAMRSNFVSSLLTEFVLSLATPTDINSSVTSPLGREDIKSLARYIEQNAQLPLTIDNFTALTNLSKHHLIRLFTSQLGIPPYRYLNMCRVNRAQVLLRTTQLSVAQIAEEVGYSDPAILIRHFKYFHTVTPSVYRRENV